LAKVKARVDAGRIPEDGVLAVIGSILRWDPSLAIDVVLTLLPDSGETSQQVRSRLTLLQHWAGESPSLAKVLATGLVQRATDLSGMGKQQTASLLLDTAEAMHPELCDQCARKRLEWLKKNLAENDYAGVLRGLDGMHINNYSAPVSGEVASVFLEVAQQASKTNTAVAQRAMDRAFELQPTLGDSEPNVLLWISLHPEAGSEKLRQCQHFLSSFSTSEQRPHVQMEIIRDAVAFARAGGARSARQYLDAAYTEATSLLEKEPALKGLHPEAWTLAQRLADAEQYDKAVQVGSLFLKAFPETPLKQDIEGMVASWRTIPNPGPRREAPSEVGPRPGGRDETLEAKLLRRKRNIGTSTAIYDAVANKEIWIIEVADTCTADQFDAEQARLLRNWVSEGGVLWVNSNVLSLLNIRCSPANFSSISSRIECVAAGGTHPILEGVKKVTLSDIRNKAHTLEYRGVIPLLATREIGGMFSQRGDITLWSLVPYGRGWVSDRKHMLWEEPNNAAWGAPNDDGALFWGRFCQFCLHELPWPPPSDNTTSGGQLPGSSDPGAPTNKESLSGRWESATGARLRLDDDGAAVTVELMSSPVLQSFSGKLNRGEKGSDSKTLTGVLDAVFQKGASKRYSLHVTATQSDSDHVKLRFANWPVFNNSGREMRTQAFTEDLTRSEQQSGDQPSPPARRSRAGDKSAPRR
jgi:hypothetical protein